MQKIALKVRLLASAALIVGLTLPAVASAEDLKTLPAPNKPLSTAAAVAAAHPAPAAHAASGPDPSLLVPIAGSSETIPEGSGAVAVPGNPPGALPAPGASPASPLAAPATVPKIVQEAVTGLQKTDPINLDDMVRAQDAINRLDLLLEIEKRQNELKKLRDDRNKVATLGAGIPASALNLPPRGTLAPVASNPMPPTSRPPVPEKPSGNFNLKRIVGVEGRYSAVMSDGDKVVNVRSGETLPDGSKIKTVTLTSVSLVKDQKSKTLTIPSDSYIVRGSEDVPQ